MVLLQRCLVFTSLIFILEFRSLAGVPLDRGETLVKRLADDLAVLIEYEVANAGSPPRSDDLDRLRLLQDRVRVAEALGVVSGDQNDIQKVILDLQDMAEKHRAKRGGDDCDVPAWCGYSGKYEP
ncbi:uncharacterized protein LOC128246227 [Mya arenaria]|uniref:uncharacterized protein LOC128246227 n=1 Tax=Mya arenaria TaxID=6604 RepID=UPI0022E43A1E|nr:uncharacterized protein LOC128246227 [Mya arenaria]